MTDPVTALSDLAAALNACTDAGIPVSPLMGMLTSRAGYVVADASGRWSVRSLVPVTLPPLPASLNDDDWP